MRTVIYNEVEGARKCCPEDTPILFVAIRESIKELSACYFPLLSDLPQAAVPYVSTSHGHFGHHTACHWLKKLVYLLWPNLREKRQWRKDRQKPERERRGQLSAVSNYV
jgi:hypothetical protein